MPYHMLSGKAFSSRGHPSSGTDRPGRALHLPLWPASLNHGWRHSYLVFRDPKNRGFPQGPSRRAGLSAAIFGHCQQSLVIRHSYTTSSSVKDVN